MRTTLSEAQRARGWSVALGASPLPCPLAHEARVLLSPLTAQLSETRVGDGLWQSFSARGSVAVSRPQGCAYCCFTGKPPLGWSLRNQVM